MAKKKAQPQLPAWVWLFTGVVTGLFAAFLVYLANVKGTPVESGPRTRGSSINGSVNASAPTSAGIPPGGKPGASTGGSSSNARNNNAGTASTTSASNDTNSEPEPLSPADRARKFEFYTLLPEAETLGAPDDDKPAAKSSDAGKPADANKADDSKSDAAKQRTLLQTGSFQRAQDAEKLRAQIILLGLPASIQKVEVRPGETWHRVQAGPFTDAGSLTQAQKALTGAHIQHIVIRLKNS